MNRPSMDVWMEEAKKALFASECGMYLFHSGVVRGTPKAKARRGEQAPPVAGMEFSYDGGAVELAIADTYKMPGIYHVRVWLNEGRLKVGDDIMLVLVGGDIRPHVVDALQALVSRIKSQCVTETELFDSP